MTGYVVAITDLVERHRVERAAYRRMLHIADRHTSITPPRRRGARGRRNHHRQGSVQTALDVLQRILGAHRILA